MNRFQSWYSVQPRALKALLTINVAIYVVWQVFLVHIGVVEQFVWGHLALNPRVALWEPWQLLTYNFLHLQGGFWGLLHLGFNMLWLYWIGKEYEELHGAHRLFSAYVLSGLGGGLLTVLLHAIFPGIPAFGGPVHGASGAVLGVITVVAVRYPYKSVALMFIGVVRLIYLVIGYLVLNLLFLSGGNMSVSAHVGGALFGFLLAKGEAGGRDLSGWARVFFRDRRGRGTRRGSKGPDDGLLARLENWLATRGKKKPAEAEPHTARVHTFRPSDPDEGDSTEAEVDRILEKISAHGYEALSEEEKRILYEASKR